MITDTCANTTRNVCIHKLFDIININQSIEIEEKGEDGLEAENLSSKVFYSHHGSLGIIFLLIILRTNPTEPFVTRSFA